MSIKIEAKHLQKPELPSEAGGHLRSGEYSISLKQHTAAPLHTWAQRAIDKGDRDGCKGCAFAFVSSAIDHTQLVNKHILFSVLLCCDQ